MIPRPAVTTTTTIRDAAKIMAARHLRHLPVADNARLLGVIGVADVCRALSNAEDRDRNPASDSGPHSPSRRLQQKLS